ncbi:Rpn family recombination-promoting nuclease/putative transposase [Leptospira interrogans]|uniref:Transposase, YhgA-like domain protein n=2 Tax=Leptospira interrogans TaxID=173 RepID=A0A0E2D8G8_LEPIR|nr:Rpn family recombination-promoting nuclease/putative transposase [Leptospira interrogans]EMF70985.1 transposase, YhgA-like domain protein [Leptospira interrogans serovar Canicola str. LT1962]EKR56154.1 transposase, YhgA-like domain protein [Leptospira interrogans str. UI 12758]EMM90394.1 transposase, YhgA-like domain protein [Leptospira interrogans serovar Djasiman str. LT1649]EMN79676.1 transposase, YhgA-like domain protein [Leptospira interrogans serovar Grippotyphosa str. UI 12764]MBM288
MIRATFQNKKEADIFFKSTLPHQLLFRKFRTSKSSFTSEKLKQTDLLFQILLKSKNKTNVYLLFEYNSYSNNSIELIKINFILFS